MRFLMGDRRWVLAEASLNPWSANREWTGWGSTPSGRVTGIDSKRTARNATTKPRGPMTAAAKPRDGARVSFLPVFPRTSSNRSATPVGA